MTKKETKEKRMEDIIRAAVDEFIEKGYEKTSVESIALRAGVSKGGVYYYFQSKDEILLAANQKLSEPIYEMMLRAKESSSVKQGLSMYIREYLAYWIGHEKELYFFFLSLSKAINWPAAWPLYQEYTDFMLDFMIIEFQKGITNGEFKVHDPRSSALALLSALDGVLGYLVMNKNLSLTEIIGVFEERFIHSLTRTT